MPLGQRLGCLRNSVDTEFRLFFFTSGYSVFSAELPIIPRNFAEFPVVKCSKISRNFVIFRVQNFVYLQFFLQIFMYVHGQVRSWTGTILDRYIHVQVSSCRGMYVHAQVHSFKYRYVRSCTCTFIYRFVYAEVSSCTGTLMYRYLNVQVRSRTGTIMYRYVRVQACSGIGTFLYITGKFMYVQVRSCTGMFM